MCDYKNGKIYQVVCNITGETYIGSTAVSLEERLRIHKKSTNPCRSKQIIERGDYYIELLETYPCNNEFELYRKEGEYQKSMKCINRNIAGRTIKEWREDNKEIQSIKRKKYRIENAEKIKSYSSQVVVCECGFHSSYNHFARHKRSKKHIDLMNKLTLPSNYLLGVEKVLVC